VASFSHDSYSFPLGLGLIALSFIRFVPLGTECRDGLLLSTMSLEVVCHFTPCACLVVPSSIPNIFRYGVVSFITVRMYYLLFVGSCLFLRPCFHTGYLRLSLIGGLFFRRIPFGGSCISLCWSPVFGFSTYQCPRGFALSMS